MRLYTKRSFDAPFFHNLFEVSDGVTIITQCRANAITASFQQHTKFH